MSEAAKVLEVAAEHLGVGAAEPAGVKLYPHNVLEGFGNGCLLDLRVRLAIDFLKSPMMQTLPGEGGWQPREVALYALDISTALLDYAEARGLIDDLPEDDGLNRQARLQSVRTARYAVLQQMAGARISQEEAGRVAPVAPFGRTFNG